MTADAIHVDELDDGALWHVLLATPKGNVIDAAMSRALASVFARAGEAQGLKALCLDAEGPSFSYGASVEEHLPDRVAGMLATFHGALRALAGCGVTVLAAVRGQCLGGGLELITLAQRIFAAPGAKLGQPEIRLGVFAPAASALLPERIGRAAAEDLCLTGRVLTAAEAHAIGLVDEVCEDPTAAALEYARGQLLPHSASSLRHALGALRGAFHRRVLARLEEVERLYLDELMRSADATEGIEAFLQKREPHWSDA